MWGPRRPEIRSGEFSDLLGPLDAITGSYYAEIAPKQVIKETSKPKVVKPVNKVNGGRTG
jgi:hypothetical protein